MRRAFGLTVVAVCAAFDVLAAIIAVVGPRGYAACGTEWLIAMVLAIILGTLGIPLALGAAGGVALARRDARWLRPGWWLVSVIGFGGLALAMLVSHAVTGAGGAPLTCSP